MKDIRHKIDLDEVGKYERLFCRETGSYQRPSRFILSGRHDDVCTSLGTVRQEESSYTVRSSLESHV